MIIKMEHSALHLAVKNRLARCAAFACYLASAELFASLVRGVAPLPRIVGGVVVTVLFLLWELWGHRSATPPTEGGPVPDSHRDELQQLAAAYSTSVAYWRPTRGKQHPLLEQSFWSHFPTVGKVLGRWDVVLDSYEQARTALWTWLDNNGGASLVATSLTLGRAVEDDRDLDWSVNSDYLWLDGGWGVEPVAADTDVDELKRPYEELLARARKALEGRALRDAALAARATQQVALTELEGVRALHVIRGKCDLC